MGKFPFKRPRIITKRFPEVDSSIDSVKKSLNDLVFSYSEKVDNALQKKHLMMAISSMVLLIVFGSFISPKGKADSAIFYPNTCLGGWVNPHYAEGMLETTSNGDPSQFTKNNSAVLPKNTNAEMYCGNFKGKFDPLTKPTKIVVSLALTKGQELLLEDRMESINFASSSRDILDAASSTDVSFTLLASTSTDTSTSSQEFKKETSSSTSVIESLSSASSTEEQMATSSDDISIPTAVAVPVTVKSDSVSIVEGIKESVKDAFDTLFNSNDKPAPQTDTVIIPATNNEENNTPPQEPQSYLVPSFGASLIAYFTDKVFAEEEASESVQVPAEQTPQQTLQDAPQQDVAPTPIVIVPNVDTPVENIPSVISDSTSTQPDLIPESSPNILKIDQATTASIVSETATTITVDLSKPVASSSDVVAASSTEENSNASTTSASTTSIIVEATSTISASTTPVDDNQFQNNFLEVFYSFDGVTWNVLGELNEISMKYRTFEIPVTASTSWEDLGRLQIKIQAKRHFDETPTVYLDGIKVEVLYETEISHAHPDFARDTILKDEIIEDIRLVTLVNSETKQQEVWYMHLENASPTEDALIKEENASTTAVLFSTSTSAHATTTATTSQDISFATTSTSTDLASATSTKSIINLMKNTWKKFVGNGDVLTSLEIVKAIKKQEHLENLDALDLLPDFASDTIKRMKGVLSHAVLVQIGRSVGGESFDELWLYDMSTTTPERIGGSTTSQMTISPDSPLGIKGGYIFWVSLDKKTVYAYSLFSKNLLEKPIPSYNESHGERAEVFFDGIPWKVIITRDEFSFSSSETGEVFSDENADVVAILRSKMKLDGVLNKEELSSLSLPVSEDISTSSLK